MASRVSLEILSRLWTYAFDSRIWLNIVHGYVFICWAQNGDTVSIFSIVGRVTLLITCVLLVISTFQGFNFIRRKCLPLVPFSFCNSNALDLFLFWFFFILNQTRVINFSDLKKKRISVNMVLNIFNKMWCVAQFHWNYNTCNINWKENVIKTAIKKMQNNILHRNWFDSPRDYSQQQRHRKKWRWTPFIHVECTKIEHFFYGNSITVILHYISNQLCFNGWAE